MTFKDCIPFVIKDEGGYTNDPKDRGGETKFGITKMKYPNLEISKVTEGAAMDLFQKDYWAYHRIDLLPEHLRYAVFDFCVNSGTWAIKILQRCANIEEDGIIGKMTAKAAIDVTLEEYTEARVKFIVKANLLDVKFKPGIIIRCYRVMIRCLKNRWNVEKL
jgi:lysozyme family protein